MTYAQVVLAAADTGWISRVRAAIVEAAIAIAEDAPDAGLETRRDRLARNVLVGADVWVLRFALPVAEGFLGGADLTEGTVNDAAVASRVSAVWNKFLDP